MKTKQIAAETKAEKQMARMRTNEQRAQEEARARNMKDMIQAQKQQAAEKRQFDLVDR